ncbi:MAG: hypothetical protein HQM00_16185 [Magnetococcales bacterium]|nr:hypothetical protein [Magnetococcales bacterium]
MKIRPDPRVTVLAFAWLVPVLMLASIDSVVWWIGCGWVWLAAWAASLSWRFVGRGLWRFRWLFLLLLLIHGLMTPGELIWSEWLFVTREGVIAGVHQGLRLLMLAVLAWSVARITTPMALVGAFYFYLRGVERFGIPVGRGLSLLGFCLSGLTRFREQAHRVRQGMESRLGVAHSGGTLERWSLAGQALLSALLWDLRRREEGLRARGFDQGLPPIGRVTGRLHRSDWLLPLGPGLLWLCWLFG